MLIQFTRKVPPYNPGETAGFSAPEADRLIRLGAAVPVQTQGPAYPDKSIPQAPANRQMVRKGR